MGSAEAGTGDTGHGKRTGEKDEGWEQKEKLLDQKSMPGLIPHFALWIFDWDMKEGKCLAGLGCYFYLVMKLQPHSGGQEDALYHHLSSFSCIFPSACSSQTKSSLK